MAPIRQNFPMPEPMSSTRIPACTTSSSAARRATATGVQCRRLGARAQLGSRRSNTRSVTSSPARSAETTALSRSRSRIAIRGLRIKSRRDRGQSRLSPNRTAAK